MRDFFLVLVGFVVFLAAPSNGVRFYLNPMQVKCIGEELAKGSVGAGSYNVHPANNDRTNVRVKVTDPSGKPVFVNSENKGASGKFTVSAEKDGEYQACFTNSGLAPLGQYFVEDGRKWKEHPATFTCLEACAFVFGGNPEDYHCSTDPQAVNEKGWYDEHGFDKPCQRPLPDELDTMFNNYDQGGAISAYVDDHHECNGKINYCFAAGDDGQVGQKTITLTWETGLSRTELESVAKKENLKPLEIQLKKLEDQITNIHDEMLYMRGRSESHHKTNESTNRRVLWFGLFTCIVLIALSGFTIHYLRRFFEKKKII